MVQCEEDDLQGQPQCRRKVIIVGFPFGFGSWSLGDEGAFEPSSGTGDILTAFGDIHEVNSCWNVIVAVGKGIGKGNEEIICKKQKGQD